jgi:transcriptional regulator with XRE-family HTH domain
MSKKRTLRRAADLTQFALARTARVPRSKIADVETGRGQYTPAERRRILAVLAHRIGRNMAELHESLAPSERGKGDWSSGCPHEESQECCALASPTGESHL